MIRCSDNSLYCGITTDLARRVAEHNGEMVGKGAKFTRSRRPVTLVYFEQYKSRSGATKREIEVKNMKKDVKEILLLSQ